MPVQKAPHNPEPQELVYLLFGERSYAPEFDGFTLDSITINGGSRDIEGALIVPKDYELVIRQEANGVAVICRKRKENANAR